MTYTKLPILIVAVAAILFSATETTQARPGDPDQTFGKAGYADTNIPVPAGMDWIEVGSMVVQPDGKVIVAGRFWQDGISYWYGTWLVRFIPNGDIDTSFGKNGKVSILGSDNTPYQYSAGGDVVLQPDGKIVVIGEVAIGQGILIQRFTPSGQLDPTFGSNGNSVVSGMEANSVGIQPDGKIVGVGWEFANWWDISNYYDAILLFRLNSDGSLDKAFGGKGTGFTKIVDGYDDAKLLVQHDGKILVWGMLLNFRTVFDTAVMARYNQDGSLDSSFGSEGILRNAIGGNNSYLADVEVQPSGKILIKGPGGPLIRLEVNGALDSDFQKNLAMDPAVVLLSIVSTDNGHIDMLAARGGSKGASVLVRMNEDGSPDRTFGDNGEADFPSFEALKALKVDGRLLMLSYMGLDQIGLFKVSVENGFSISGRVLTSSGRGLRGSTVTVTGTNGTSRTVVTSALGFYSFDNMTAGQSYTVSVRSKQFRFEPRTVTPVDNLSDLDFVGLE